MSPAWTEAAQGGWRSEDGHFSIRLIHLTVGWRYCLLDRRPGGDFCGDFATLSEAQQQALYVSAPQASSVSSREEVTA